MNLTRRGKAVVGVVVLAELLAIGFGARALNAIVAPAAIALGAGAFQLYLRDDPAAERTTPVPGFPGDRRTVTLDIDGTGLAQVEDRIGDGLRASGADRGTALPTTVSYDLTYAQRGVHTLGPLSVRVRDALSLWETVHEVGWTNQVVVYPTIYQLEGARELVEETLGAIDIERREFDALREYAPGDPLRDVHWKTTAKQPTDIFVTEFTDRQFDEEIVIAASGEEANADAMAAAAASIAVMALDQGLAVGLHVPFAQRRPDQGQTHRERLLETLARTTAEGVPPGTHDSADISVKATDSGVEVRFGDVTRELDEMTVSRQNPYREGVPA